MEIDPIREIETDARNLRLAEQAVFRMALNSKRRKFKRLLFFTIAGFVLAIAAWLLFHCLPLVLKTP